MGDIEKLKKLAKEHGFYLLKKKPYEKMLPCVCGCKQHSYNMQVVYDERRGVSLAKVKFSCKKCGLQPDELSMTKDEAKLVWNKFIEEKKNGC